MMKIAVLFHGSSKCYSSHDEHANDINDKIKKMGVCTGNTQIILDMRQFDQSRLSPTKRLLTMGYHQQNVC